MMRYVLIVFLFSQLVIASSLEAEWKELTKGFPGRVGACVEDAGQMTCVNGQGRYSLQSVVKLIVGVVIGESVDHKRLRFDDPVIIRKADLSLAVQPLSKLVGPNGFQTTIGDLVRRAIIDSDSAAVDNLIAKLGGTGEVQQALLRMKIDGIRVDRDERHLQTDTQGLTWRQEFVDPEVLAKAQDANSKENRTAAYARYQKDVRDTATPHGMTRFLTRLSSGQLLSPASTAFVMKAMEECATFPDRLKGGAPQGWTVAHKTGSSGSWNGMTVATNDVGVLTAPDGKRLAITVFIADSTAELAERARLMREMAAAAVRHHDGAAKRRQ